MLSSPYDPTVVAIRDEIGAAVTGEPSAEQVPAIVTNALEVAFPELVSSELALFGYGWRINPETGEWEYFCESLHVLTIQTTTPVEVRIRVSSTRSD